MRALAFLGLIACASTSAPTSAPAKPRIDTTDPLAFLLADASVIAFDLAALRRSEQWPMVWAVLEPLLSANFAPCTVDLFKTASSVTASLPSGDVQGVFVIRGIPRDATLACVLRDDSSRNDTVTTDGTVVTMKNVSGHINMFVFADATTLLMRGSTHPTREDVIATLESGAPMRHNPSMLARFEKVKGGHFWAVTDGEILDRVEAMFGERPLHVDAALRLDSMVHFDAWITFHTEDRASALAERMSRNMFANSIAGHATADDAVLLLSFELTPAQAVQLLSNGAGK